MNVLKIMIVLLVLIMSLGAVCAADNISNDIISNGGQDDIYLTSTNSFTNLADEIENTGTSLDLTQDYAFNNETDNETGITISKDNFILNGNGRTIDATNQSKIFNITGNNITLNDLILINGNAYEGGAIYSTGTLTLNNITFINNYATKYGGAIMLCENSTINCYDSKFIDNTADVGSSIYINGCELNLYNSEVTSKIFTKHSQIIINNVKSVVHIENTTFANIITSYAPALYSQSTRSLYLINSKFINLTANITAGAVGIKNGGEIYIEKCEFINTTSTKNAGAIIADITGLGYYKGNVTIIDTSFKDTSSEFGGAYLQLGGNLTINNTEFTNSHAKYNGGAIYISYVDYGEINNCTFDSNSVDIIEYYPTYGGAIFCDISTLNIDESRFTNNLASEGNAIYTYDSSYNIENSIFKNNTQDIYTVFDKETNLNNNTYDNISTNNTYFATVIFGQGLELTLLNNTIDVETIPKKFDLRDWGWVSPVSNQGWTVSCWTFGISGALESSLLKATGIATDFSENNMQDTMIKYSIYGCSIKSEFGFNVLSIGYLLSWLGAFTQDADNYDELGKISPTITTNKDVHIQDVMFTPNNEIPNGTQLKKAIMKYGSIDANYNGQDTYNAETPYYNEETHAQYVDKTIEPNHAVSIVGWDDNFPKEKFGITPPGDGAWIVKNSWGTEWGDEGYLYVSYYDKTLLLSKDITEYATSIILENTEPYNANYQYDTFWAGELIPGNGSISYCNIFNALDNGAIAAVGTYFNESGIDYTIEIYVNDELKLTQDGVSPYYGYHTIKLNEYIPIKEGDLFKAVVTSNAMPYTPFEYSRIHYPENISFVSTDGETWKDCYEKGVIACLKVYTVALPIYTEDLVKIYKNDSKFEANIGIANETVTFEINGKNYTRVSDENGTASMAINLGPGDYTIKTTFNGTTVENTITVLPTLMADNLVKYFRNASQFYIDLIDGAGNPINGTNITMNINGVFYNRTTNENGTARLNINLIPGEYILTAIDPLTGLQMSYNITVLATMNATDMEMKYKDGSTFNVTVLDGQGKPAFQAAVTFNINGVFYTRYADSSGIVKLNINLMAGEYIITSEYDGFKIANTITIKD